mgnify:CR=1 FL=1
MSRTRFEAVLDKSREMQRSEVAGEVADSLDVRMALMARVKSGEITLDQAQTELKRIKRSAKSMGKVTRTQAFRRG